MFLILLISQHAHLIFSQSSNLPLDHWAYDFIERMETKGILSKIRDGSRPFTRTKMANLVQRIVQCYHEDPDRFTTIDIQTIERLQSEFFKEMENRDFNLGKILPEPHFYSWQNRRDYINFDLLGGGSTRFGSGDIEKSEKSLYTAYYGGLLRSSLWNVGLFSDTRIYSEWGEKKYIQNYAPSQGYPIGVNRDSSQAVWDISDSYFYFQLGLFQFEFGRDRVQWGPGQWGRLMLSGNTPSYDLLKVTAELEQFTFTWLHGELRSDFSHKWISAHRFEFSITPGLDVGIHESVIYGKRTIEIAYLNPILPYLVAEHTLGDRDNVALGMDIEYRGLNSLKIYGELFIDDLFAPWEFFNDFYGNKWAVTAGFTLEDPFQFSDSRINIEYTRIEPYVYTHKDSVNVFEHYNYGLGYHSLQPNSDVFQLCLKHDINFSLKGEILFEFTRHGQGDRQIPHQESEGTKKQFLSGVIEKEKRIGISVQWEIIRDCWLGLFFNTFLIENQQNYFQSDKDLNELSLTLNMNW